MSTSARRGITLVEVLVLILILGALVALLLPQLECANEAARRTQCNNNLRNLAISLQNYHDTYQVFPMGVMHSGLRPEGEPPLTAALGPSWWYATLPFTEGRNIDISQTMDLAVLLRLSIRDDGQRVNVGD